MIKIHPSSMSQTSDEGEGPLEVRTVFPQWRSVFATLVIVLGIILVVALPQQSHEAKAAVIILATALLWVTEAMPLMVSALLPAILFPLSGLLTMKAVCKEYFNDISMLMLATFLMAASVEECNLHRRIALKILSVLGRGEALLILGAMLTTWKLSMFMSNTATCAMMLPIIGAIIDSLRKIQKEGERQGIIALKIKVKHDGNLPPHQDDLPDYPGNDGDQEEEEDTEYAFKNDSPDFQWFCKGLILSIPYGASIGGIATLTGTPPNFVFKGYFDKTYGTRPGVPIVDYGRWMSFAYLLSLIVVVIGWHVLVLMYARRSYFALFLRLIRRITGKPLPPDIQEEDKKWSYINKTIRIQYDKLGSFRFPEVVLLIEIIGLVLLWLFKNPSGMKGWADVHRDMMGGDSIYLTDAWIVLLVSLSLFIIPNDNPFLGSRICKPPPGRKLQRSAKLLSLSAVVRKTPWDVIFLLGGGYAIAYGCEKSGLSKALADSFSFLEGQNRVVIALVISLLVACLTEVASNTASTTLLMPVLSSMSEGLKLNPLYLMVTGTVSASLAFCLPSATGPNALVFTFKQIKVLDMVRTGVFMNLLSVLVVVMGVSTWTSAILDITDVYPDWAKDPSTLNTTLG